MCIGAVGGKSALNLMRLSVLRRPYSYVVVVGAIIVTSRRMCGGVCES
ncbi:hypothetical protein [Candidatus Hydrogenosomobacter endosymbioticus]|nr:hypothetical protein [Candidatus Hydrogenosomobacter endosymbioticus]